MVGSAAPLIALGKRAAYESPSLSDIRPTLVLLVPADAVIAAIALYIAHLTHFRATSRWTELWRGELWAQPSYTVLLAISLPVLLVALHFAGAYRWRSLRNPYRVLIAVGKAVVLCASVLAATAFVLRDDVFWRNIVVVYAALAFLGVMIIRLAVRTCFRVIFTHSRWMRHTIIVGTGRTARAIGDYLTAKPHLGFRVIGYVSDPSEADEAGSSLDTLGTIDDLPHLVDTRVVDAVVAGVTPNGSAMWRDTVSLLGEVGTTVHIRRAGNGALQPAGSVREVVGAPFVTVTSSPSGRAAMAVKRAVDILGSLIGLIVLMPLMVVTALAIKLSSRGPMLYPHERVGLNGRRFRMLKFRSMTCDAETHRTDLLTLNEMTGPVFKMSDDPRVTRIGRWIRRSSIDELPQLWNVLVGDMSLVGPRPPLPGEVELYDRWQRRRLAMRPGITCLWQVQGRSTVDFGTWMNLDMEYIDNWSLGLDLRILFRTIPAVLTARGAR